MKTVKEALAFARDQGADIDDDRAREILTGPPETPLATRALLGFGIWIGAGMVAAIIDVIDDILDEGIVALSFGAVLLGLAALFSRMKRFGDLRMHLTVLAVVGAEIVIVTTFPGNDLKFALCLIALQVSVVALVANPLTRFTASSMALGLGMVVADFMLQRKAGFGDWTADVFYFGLVGAAALLWLVRDHRLAVRFTKVHTPLAWATALALVLDTFVWTVAENRYGFAFPRLASAGFGLMAVAIVIRAAREAGRPATGPALLAVMASAALVVLVGGTPWVLVGLLFLALAHARRERGLYAIALTIFGVALYGHYFHTDTSLMSKAFTTTSAGVVLLLAALGLRGLFGAPIIPRKLKTVIAGIGAAGPVAVPAGSFAQPETKQRALVALAVAASVVLALGVPLGLSAQKAMLRANGTMVLLELGPRDPRSLMQGDYMQLRYKLDLPEERDGQLVLQLDDDRVASFVRYGDGSALSDDQVRIRYRVRNYELRIGAETFLFEEGKADRYQSARYGELRVSKSGEVILVGLRDANMQKL